MSNGFYKNKLTAMSWLSWNKYLILNKVEFTNKRLILCNLNIA